ncbi:MAG: hypothetical protein Q9191_005547 [Dirinaria sp. TL-2023a]
MAAPSSSSAQATAGANEPALSEHEAALALLDLHRQAMRAQQEKEHQEQLEKELQEAFHTSTGGNDDEDVAMSTDDDLTYIESETSSATTDSEFARILAASSKPSSPAYKMLDTTASRTSPTVFQTAFSQENLDASTGADGDDDVAMTTDDDLTSIASETSSATTDSDMARIIAPYLPPASPAVSEGGSSQDSELTEIIDTGLTPPTSPFSKDGQSVIPAIPSEQRRRLGLLARGEEGYDNAEPMEQWEWLSLAKIADEARERAREQEEQYRQHEDEWEEEWALRFPIDGLNDGEDSEYEEKGNGKRNGGGKKREQKKVKVES